MRGYRELAPTPRLRPYVATLWVWGETTPAGPHRVLPDGCLDVLLSFRRGVAHDELRLDAIGTMTLPLVVRREDLLLLMGARFRPGAAEPFLGCPPSELTNHRVPLEDVWGPEGRRLLTRLAEGQSLATKRAVLEEALLARLSRTAGPDLSIIETAHRILCGTSAPLAQLPCSVGVGARQFRRRFEALVGVGPKRFSRIARFQRLLARVLSDPGALDDGSGGWAHLAVDAGYYDQAHLIRDFKEMTGLSPTRYFAERARSDRSG